jgi:hypothetical protein
MKLRRLFLTLFVDFCGEGTLLPRTSLEPLSAFFALIKGRLFLFQSSASTS